MSTLTAAQKFHILQATSGHFLTEGYPDNWEDMTIDMQDTHLIDCVWQPMEDVSLQDVRTAIDDAATMTERLVLSILDGEI